MKLCKDCKHMTIPQYYGFGQPEMCGHHLAPVDPVGGEKNGPCSLMRSPNCLIPSCGPRGDWFEQAPPKPAKTSYEEAVVLGLIEPKKSFWRRLFG